MSDFADSNTPLDIGGVDFTEHSKFSRAKKVVQAPLYFALYSDDKRTGESLYSTAIPTGTFTLERDAAYRLISDGSLFFRMSIGVSAADKTKDIYLPKDTALIIAARYFDTLSFTGATGTFVQLMKVK